MIPIITQTHLPNGLQVRLKEIHTAPLISHWVWYRVGSRNEVPGLTGVSHWVEHMQFKGTEKFPASVLDKAISRDGGMWNAFTYLDWTTYFETMPADKIRLALELEANRMVNSIFDPEEVDSERTVIISELEGSENEPLFRLDQAVQKTLFKTHPYHYEVIGEKSDLLSMTRDDLYRHYRSYYHPNNAILALAGDFDTPRMLKLIEEIYGGLPGGQTPHNNITTEAPLQAQERLEVQGPGETAYLQVSYRSPAAAQDDFFILSVLDSLLTGPSSLNMFGGGSISNKTSRLYRSLVEQELSISIGGGMQATIDPSAYSLNATVHPTRHPDDVLAAIDREIERIQNEPVSPQEIARAVKQARALFAYGSENITNQAFWLGYAEMFADHDWFQNYVNRLETVTPAQVQAAAQTYLHPHRRVVGYYLPTGQQEEEE